MDPRHNKRARREEARRRRIAIQREGCIRRYGSLFEDLKGLLCAGRLMDSEPDEFLSWVERHLNFGFPLPPYVAERLRDRLSHAAFADEEDLPETVAELLRCALTGLVGGSKGQAWKIVETWEQNRAWTDDQFRTAKRLLEEAYFERGRILRATGSIT